MKLRARFLKEGKAVFLSHLDLNRAFSRAFSRAGIKIKFTEGFNPHPAFSFSPPLSLFQSSKAEYFDFESDEEIASIKERLNAALPAGILLLDLYEPESKLSDVAAYEYEISMFFQDSVGEEEIIRLENLFSQDEIVILKKTKRGEAETNVAPLIEELFLQKSGEREIQIRARLRCGENTSLNPEYVVKIICRELKELRFSHSEIVKTSARAKSGEEFR